MAAIKSSEKSTKNVYLFLPEIELDVLASPQTDASETDRPEIIDQISQILDPWSESRKSFCYFEIQRFI